jgi:hypothetical protein
MKNRWKALGATAIFLIFSMSARIARAEETTPQTIVQFLYNSENDHAFLTSSSGWGAQSCPKATYAEIMDGKKQLQAIALAAKLAGAKVKFSGTCNSADPDYFTVTYIFVE